MQYFQHVSCPRIFSQIFKFYIKSLHFPAYLHFFPTENVLKHKQSACILYTLSCFESYQPWIFFGADALKKDEFMAMKNKRIITVQNAYKHKLKKSNSSISISILHLL